MPHALIEVGKGLRRERGPRHGQRRVDIHPAIVDLRVDHPRVLFRRRQRLQALVRLTFDRDILPVVDSKLGSQLRRINPIDLGGIFSASRLARLPHDANDLLPGNILSIY